MQLKECETPHETDATALAAHLRAHAARYFSGNGEGPAQVRLLSAEARALAALYRFAVGTGRNEQVVLVKAARHVRTEEEAARERAPVERPRITRFAEQDRRFVLEYQALARIQRHFARINDPRFGAIRVYELLPEHQALVMELVDQPTLRQLALRAGTRRSAPGLAAVRQAFNHAGAWLRSFHVMTTPAPLPSLHARRGDFIRFTDELTSYLAARGGQTSFLLELSMTMAARARAELPDELPLGITHGDYAMRNILVGAGQKVTVLDSLARHRTPIYRDIGSFLANLYCSGLPAVAHGAVLHPVRVADYRQQFLDGYFGGARPPEGAIRLHEAQALLERWSTVVWRYSLLQDRNRVALAHVAQPLVGAFFRTMIKVTLARSTAAKTRGQGMFGI